MNENDNVKEFFDAMNEDWRTRYAYVRSKKFDAMNIKDNSRVKSKIISVAHFDPCHIVRKEAVRTCNVLGILYKGKPVRLRKMRSLNNTIIAKRIKIQDIVLDTLLKADIKSFPKKYKEWDTFYEQFKKEYPKVYDLLDGHFTIADSYKNRKKKNKVHAAINSKDKRKMNNYIFGIYKHMPKKKRTDFWQKHGVEFEFNA